MQDDNALNRTSDVVALNNNWVGDNLDYLKYNQLQLGPIQSLPSYPTYYYKPERIRFTLSEIETLRKLAKDNKEAQKILAKFTDYIEVTVDFK